MGHYTLLDYPQNFIRVERTWNTLVFSRRFPVDRGMSRVSWRTRENHGAAGLAFPTAYRVEGRNCPARMFSFECTTETMMLMHGAKTRRRTIQIRTETKDKRLARSGGKIPLWPNSIFTMVSGYGTLEFYPVSLTSDKAPNKQRKRTPRRATAATRTNRDLRRSQ